MKTKELIEYLQRFDPETDTCFLVINPPGRVRHEVEGTICITDAGRSIIGLEVGGGIPFTREEVEAAEEDET